MNKENSVDSFLDLIDTLSN